jgi:hypothetical protein
MKLKQDKAYLDKHTHEVKRAGAVSMYFQLRRDGTVV